MLKFLFERLSEPQASSWNHGGGAWPAGEGPLEGVCAEVWNWLRGVPSSAVGSGGAPSPELLDQLREGDQLVRLQAAYQVAACGEQVLPALVEALENEAEAAAEHLWDKMPGNPRGSNPPACAAGLALAVLGRPAVGPLTGLLEHAHWGVRAMAADTLGNIGPAVQVAVPELASLLADGHPRVRRHAAEALGRVGPGAAPALPALIGCIRDPDVRVRHNACLALAKIGQPAEAAIPLLLETLEDEDRYVRYFAGVALRRLATPESQRVLLDALFAARWCPVTNPENMY
jgi:HEAT repeat protein